MRNSRETFTILESRSAVGGTWDLFRYPGVRSDSVMYTLGYSFRPWAGAKPLPTAIRFANTAVTLVRSLAGTAAKVTMLERSPTYIAPVPSRDHLADHGSPNRRR